MAGPMIEIFPKVSKSMWRQQSEIYSLVITSDKAYIHALVITIYNNIENNDNDKPYYKYCFIHMIRKVMIGQQAYKSYYVNRANK